MRHYFTITCHYCRVDFKQLYLLSHFLLILPFLVNECTVTDHGLVHSFDGITQVLPAEFLSVLSSTNLDFADICNFESRMRMEYHVSLFPLDC